MAWVDDRIYCHPKLMKVGKPARWTFVAAVAYSAGWGTRGRLERGEQEAIGSNAKLRAELVNAGLWEDSGDGAVLIHDWDDHNDRRDERRRKDRERKREARTSARTSAGTSAGQSLGASPGPARVEGSEGSEGSEELQKQDLSKAVPVANNAARGEPPERPQIASEEVRHLIDTSLKEAAA